MQVKLLGYFKKKVTRIGVTQKLVNMRVIAATNLKFKEEVKMGKFRDIYIIAVCYSSSYSSTKREKRRYITINRILHSRKAQKLKKYIWSLDKDLLDQLLKYSWPGNVRELENIIENIVNLDGRMSIKLFDEEEKWSFAKGKMQKVFII